MDHVAGLIDRVQQFDAGFDGGTIET